MVAVASNFTAAARTLADEFQRHSGHKVVLVSGSTGKQYAQIVHGAPFDVFLAADSRRPQRLEREKRTAPGSRFTYAFGRLVLWSPDPALVDEQGLVLVSGQFDHLAIANPRLAPYGRAARQVLQALHLWDGQQSRLVQGENIGQAHQFVRSGNAELGLLAYSQVLQDDGRPQGSLWFVPDNLYEPIEQQAVLLRDGPVARAFLNYLKGREARSLIRQFGYGVP